MSETVRIRVRVLPHGEGLALPRYESDGASGMDLRAAIREPMVLQAGEVAAIPTGLMVEIPSGLEMQVRPRSGLALRHGITCLNTPGTVDSDYRGEIRVILANLGAAPFTIERGMRIAQAVIAPVIRARLDVVDDLTQTGRGSDGFGSTGI